MANIKPIAVLSLICAVVCALLIVTYDLTYVDTSGIITDDLMNACVSAGGEGDYVLITDREAAGLSGDEFKAVKKIIKRTNDNTFMFEMVTDGYSADGIDAVVAFDTGGNISAVSIVALSETPGLGTKINDPAFLEKFKGYSSSVTISKNPPSADNEIQAMTGATYSSRGLAEAVNTAIAAYSALNREVQPE